MTAAAIFEPFAIINSFKKRFIQIKAAQVFVVVIPPKKKPFFAAEIVEAFTNIEGGAVSLLPKLYPRS
jgi:hypothetical protein